MCLSRSSYRGVYILSKFIDVSINYLVADFYALRLSTRDRSSTRDRYNLETDARAHVSSYHTLFRKLWTPDSVGSRRHDSNNLRFERTISGDIAFNEFRVFSRKTRIDLRGHDKLP
jgi:hypothetical protein